jgi:predicted  nucleic acid-binding Zn-ribbon protein
MDLSPEALRQTFAELTGQYDAIEEQLAAAHAELGALLAGDTELTVRQALDREAELRAAIRGLNEQQFPIEQDRATIVRALAGNSFAVVSAPAAG